MKKSFLVAVSLFLLSFVGAIIATANIWSPVDDIVITEEIQYGDQSVVEGVNVKLQLYIPTGWGWTVEHTLGAQPNTETEVSSGWKQPTYNHLPYTNLGETETLTEYKAEFAEAIAKMIGSANASVEPRAVKERTNLYGIMARGILCYYETKTYAGTIISGCIDLYGKEVDNTVYCRVRDSSFGYNMEEVQEEKGFGLYAFDVNPKTKEIAIDSLRTVYEAAEGEYVQQFYFDEKKNQILAYTTIGENNYLHVIDRSTYEEVQKIELYDYTVSDCKVYDDFMILIMENEKLMVFSENENGAYHKEFQHEVSEEYVDRSYYRIDSEDAYDWDGTRLLVAGMLWNGGETGGFFVSVYDANGLLYHGKYTNSIDIADGDCEHAEVPIQISWN